MHAAAGNCGRILLYMEPEAHFRKAETTMLRLCIDQKHRLFIRVAFQPALRANHVTPLTHRDRLSLRCVEQSLFGKPAAKETGNGMAASIRPARKLQGRFVELARLHQAEES